MLQSKFFHFFPVPSFLRMPAAGLSMSDDAVRFVRFEHAESALKLESRGEAKLPAGTIVDGNIANREAAAKALGELRTEHRLRLVRATIPDEKAYLFKLSLPKLEPHEIRSALEFKIEENVPISLKDAVFDYVVLDEEGPAGELQIVAAAAHQKAVSAYVETLRSAGLEPVSLELESQSIASAVIPKSEEKTVLLVHFSEMKTGLYLARRGIVEFSLTIPADAAEDAPAGPVPPPAPAAAPESGKANAAYEKLYSPKYKKLPLVREEIERIANYWQSRNYSAGEEPFRIILSGLETSDHDFVEHFSTLLKREMSVGNVWENALPAGSAVPDMQKTESYGYAAAIGAALSDFKYDASNT